MEASGTVYRSGTRERIANATVKLTGKGEPQYDNTDDDGDFTDETTPVSVSISNRATWGEMLSPVPSLSLAGLAAAMGLLAVLALVGLKRRAQGI